MRLWSLISRLLSILAILGLFTAPMATPSVAVAMAQMMDMGAMPDDMSCCPDQKQSLPDCQKSCPVATNCMAKCAPGVAQRDFALFRLDRAVNVDPYKDQMRDPTTGAPPDRPPRI